MSRVHATLSGTLVEQQNPTKQSTTKGEYSTPQQSAATNNPTTNGLCFVAEGAQWLTRFKYRTQDVVFGGD